MQEDELCFCHNLTLQKWVFLFEQLWTPKSFFFSKVWSHLLGLQCNGTYLPRTDVYAGVPTHYESLIKKYQEVLKVSFCQPCYFWIKTLFFFVGKENERICPRVLLQENQIDGQWRRTHQSGLACTMDTHYWTHHQTLLKEARCRLSHRLFYSSLENEEDNLFWTNLFPSSSSLQFKKRTSFFWWWRQQLLRTASVCERMTASRFI